VVFQSSSKGDRADLTRNPDRNPVRVRKYSVYGDCFKLGFAVTQFRRSQTPRATDVYPVKVEAVGYRSLYDPENNKPQS